MNSRALLAAAAAAAVAMAPVALGAQTPAVDSARAAGMVGERYDGYLGLAADPGSSTRAQVGAINIKRRALYSQLAAQRGVTAQEVGLTAGCTLLTQVPVGGAYLLADGLWRRRGPGEAVVLPGYCR